jgi:catechol 2,3-dioxygenase-like lactoylglutathione lyase family enzyme
MRLPVSRPHRLAVRRAPTPPPDHDSPSSDGRGCEPAACWPAGLTAHQVRLARPTDRLEAVAAFYTDGLGLPRLGGFADHDGYDGVFVGLPGTPYHLELTRHAHGSPGDAPSTEHLLVLYLGTAEAVASVVDRLRDHGHVPVPADNPYWSRVGAVTVPDPDGWRVVLVPSEGIGHRPAEPRRGEKVR